jgi:hypothetical protein
MRWIDGILKDLKALGVRNKKSAALDRSKWIQIVHQSAKILTSGL